MNSPFTFLKNSWNSLILHLPSQAAVSFFIVYGVFFSSFNIWRACTDFRFTFSVFLFFLGGIALLSLLFLRSPKLFERVLALIFSDFSWRHHKTISFGMTLMRDWPFVFAVYASLSLSSLYLVREHPADFAYYVLYVGCVSFRNMFLVPYLGYSLIVKINEKKVELLSEKEEGESSSPFPLFSNTSLLQNTGFCGHVLNWTELVSALKPSPASSRKISLVTGPTSLFWFSYPSVRGMGSEMIDLPLSHIKEIESGIFPIIHNGDMTIPQNLLLKKLASMILENAKPLQEEATRFREMGQLRAGLYGQCHPGETEGFLRRFLQLAKDSRDLSYCFHERLEGAYSHRLLIRLTTKYVPECAHEVARDLRAMSSDFTTKNEIFTPREDIFEFVNVLRGFFWF